VLHTPEKSYSLKRAPRFFFCFSDPFDFHCTTTTTTTTTAAAVVAVVVVVVAAFFFARTRDRAN